MSWLHRTRSDATFPNAKNDPLLWKKEFSIGKGIREWRTRLGTAASELLGTISIGWEHLPVLGNPAASQRKN
jgi:hypothetical protein